MRKLIIALFMLSITAIAVEASPVTTTHVNISPQVPAAVQTSFTSVVSDLVLSYYGPDVIFTEDITWERSHGIWHATGLITISNGHTIQIVSSSFTNKGTFISLNYLLE